MSNETKWTPGQWVVFGDWGIQDQNNRLIAQFGPLNDDGNGNSEESFANAHLIAAAPAHDEALYMVESKIPITPNVFGGDYMIQLSQDEVDLIRATLAKARGEQ